MAYSLDMNALSPECETRTISATELRDTLDAVLAEVEKDVEFLVTKRGKPIGRFVKPESESLYVDPS